MKKQLWIVALLLCGVYSCTRPYDDGPLNRTPKKEEETSTISDDPTPISFASYSVRTELLKLYDSNEDGEISYAEASRVTDLGTLFKNNCDIKSFDELQYFTSLARIPNFAFARCNNLTSVVIPKSAKSIGEGAFSGCSRLASVVISKGVRSIGEGAFSDCASLASVVIPESVKSIRERAFSDCDNLASVVIPKSVTSIANVAFAGCRSLTSVVIPESVTSIGSYAFSDCSSLTSVVIPKGVRSIGSSAFDGCSSLTSLTLPSTLKSIDGSLALNASCVITVPKGYAEKYRQWFPNNKVVEANV